MAHGSRGGILATIFLTATLVNYPWELAQSFLYVGMGNVRLIWWHCLVASLGDGVLVLLLFTTGWVVLGRPEWFLRPGVRGAAVILAGGFVLGVSVEWVAVYITGRWAYTAQMPLIPGIGVGIVPVAQMLFLPPLILGAVAVLRTRSAAKRSQRNG